LPEVKSSMPKIITTGYQALQLIYFFTAGNDEVRAWTIRKLTKAPQAAGVMYALSMFHSIMLIIV
jgi:obg-like ATPase 1